MSGSRVDPKHDLTHLALREMEERIRKSLPKTSSGDHVPHAVGGVGVALIEYMTHRFGKPGIGKAFALGWVIWESAEVILWLVERSIASDRERTARRDGFRHELWNGFWSTQLDFSMEVREAAFDRLAGNLASHGVVPSLSPQAAQTRMEMVNSTSDRWVTSLSAMKALEDYIQKGPHTGEVRFRDSLGGGGVIEVTGRMHFNESGEYVHTRRPEQLKEASIAEAREKIQAYQSAMVEDVKKVMDFDANPANWNLTDEQRARLPYHGPDPPPSTI